MDDVISSLTGIRESTMTAGVSSGSIPAPLGIVKQTGKDRLAKLRRRRGGEKYTRENVIPADATKLDSSDDNDKGEKSTDQFPEPLIKTSVALVAPDTTPNAEVPLDPSQVPVTQSQPAGISQVEPVVPSPVKKPEGAMSTLLGIHQDKFKPELASLSPVEVNAIVEKTMNSMGKEDSSPQSGKASKLIADAMAGKAPEIKNVPVADRGAKVSAIMHQLLD